jgi:dienelactone hydrolase
MKTRKLPLALLLFAALPRLSADLASIPATTYEMLDAATGMQVQVSIGSFAIAPTEVTQKEFAAAMGYNPSHYKGETRPVENVSWWEAIRYANLRSQAERLRACYNLVTGARDTECDGYRLPTEAEWAYAAAGEGVPKSAGNLGIPATNDVAPLVESFQKGGTKPVASYAPNKFGLYDMTGNVWEWCGDYYNALRAPVRLSNPAGPAWGAERVIRGGSFMSLTSGWAGKEYRSGMNPDTRSPYTGFRVCRTLSTAHHAPARALDTLYSKAPAGYESATGALSPLLDGVATADAWRVRREAIRAKWEKLLGAPQLAPFTPAVREVDTFRQYGTTTRVISIQTEPDRWMKASVVEPAGGAGRPLPVLIVPFYDVDSPNGMNMGGRRLDPLGGVSFAYLAAQRGYLAVSVRWFGMDYGESFAEAMTNLALRHPGCTGLGKWVWDAHRLLDYLYTRPDVDRSRIAMMGWSLGGKMTLYATALDERIAAAVSFEPGIGLPLSNYGDYWYLGAKPSEMPAGMDQHELLGLIAPRGYLLFGGGQSDTRESWHYINAARSVYALLGAPQNIGYLFEEKAGHRPPPEIVSRAFNWLTRY